LVCFNLAVAAEQITLPIGEQTRSSELSLPVRSMTKKQFRGLSGFKWNPRFSWWTANHGLGLWGFYGLFWTELGALRRRSVPAEQL